LPAGLARPGPADSARRGAGAGAEKSRMAAWGCPRGLGAQPLVHLGQGRRRGSADLSNTLAVFSASSGGEASNSKRCPGPASFKHRRHIPVAGAVGRRVPLGHGRKTTIRAHPRHGQGSRGQGRTDAGLGPHFLLRARGSGGGRGPRTVLGGAGGRRHGGAARAAITSQSDQLGEKTLAVETASGAESLRGVLKPDQLSA